MKKFVLAILLGFTFAGAGCTTLSLERHTVNQSMSASEYRYKATLQCLAMVAADHGTLPSYALLSGGTVAITNTGIAGTTTIWGGAPEKFANQTLSFTGSHAPLLRTPSARSSLDFRHCGLPSGQVCYWHCSMPWDPTTGAIGSF